MIRSTLLLVGSSTRWVAPTFLVLFWTGLVVGAGGADLGALTAVFVPFTVWGCWASVVAGNVDDDPHRELLAAAVGSPAKLHLGRANAVVVASIALATILAGVLVLAIDDPSRTSAEIALAAICLLVAGALIGVGIGSFLHRPILRNRGAGILLAVAALTGVFLLPPVQVMLLAINDGRLVITAVALVGATGWYLVALMLSASLAVRRGV